jgi:alpha-glucosidase (family GH31 glycosyl hydrolase)
MSHIPHLVPGLKSFRDFRKIDVAGKGTVVSRTYNIDEIPVFVKAGAVVEHVLTMSTVHREPVGRSSRANERLEFAIYPTSAIGATGSSAVYEDDGSSTGYRL